MDKIEIDKFCNEFGIEEYIINEDMSVTVHDDLWLDLPLNYTELPLTFHEVHGDVHFVNSSLTTLKGCPKFVYGSFYCCGLKLTSLEFAPQYVEGEFDCRNNQLTSLKFLPEIGDGLLCAGNSITITSIFELETEYEDRVKYYIETELDLELYSCPETGYIYGNNDFETWLGINDIVTNYDYDEYGFKEPIEITFEYAAEKRKHTLNNIMNS